MSTPSGSDSEANIKVLSVSTSVPQISPNGHLGYTFLARLAFEYFFPQPKI